jgi:putative ABC transport system substrate-binding protein
MSRRIAYSFVAIMFLTLSVFVPAEAADKMYRIGLLLPGPRPQYVAALVDGLRDLGYVEGRNLVILRKSADGQKSRLSELAAQLVRQKVDVIVGPGSATSVAIKTTSTIPIVVTVSGSYINRGWAQSLRQPGGNVTGLSTLATGLMGKQLELLKETVPILSRVAIIYIPGSLTHAGQIREAKEAAPILGLNLVTVPVKNASDLPAVFDRMKAEKVDGFVVLRSGFLVGLRGPIYTSALAAGLPSMSGHIREAVAGGLLAYGADTKALFRSAASYVAKILEGTDPAVLPISQATRFNLTVNLKTAKALGIKVPRSILLRATKVIE